MMRQPSKSKRTDTLFPPPTLLRAVEAAKDMGPVRALVTAACIGWATRTIGRDGKYESAVDLDTYKKVLEVNLVGTFNCVRLAATAMSQTEPLADNEKGAIVTRSEERRVGEECVSTCRYRCSPYQ